MTRALRPTLAVALLLAPATARAQEASRDTTVLSPVVITATRVNAGAESPLVSTTVMTGEDLRARGILTVQEALNQVPGALTAQTGSYGGQTSLFLRGGESDYAQVLVDGRAINDPGGAIDLAYLTTDNVDRIEIVRGPTSVLYGANAVTGVVQIFTRDGSGARRVSVSASGGTYGTLDYSGSFLSGGEHASVSLQAAHYGTDGIYPFNGSARDNVVSAAGRIAPDSATDIKLAVRYLDAGTHIPTNYYGAVVDSNQAHLQRQWIGSLDAGRSFTSRLEARVLVGYSHNFTRSADGPNSASDPCDFCYDTHDVVEQWSADARLNFRAFPTLVLTGGAAYEHQQNEQDSAAAVTRGIGAGYVQALGSVGTRFSYTVGARLDDNSAFGSFGTYRAAVGYALLAGTRLRASVGNAFKAPTFEETSSTAPFDIGNPDLKPERSVSWEVGAEQEIASGALVIDVAYFQQRFSDMIQYNGSPPTDSSPNYVNVAKADADGIETALRASMWRIVSATATFTWLATKVTDAGLDSGPAATFVEGQPLLRRPKYLADLRVGVRPSPRGFAEIGVRYVGSRPDIDYQNFVRVTAPAYTLVDVSGEVTVLTEVGARPSVTLTLRATNLFDAHYQAIYGFQSPGRAIIAGARVGAGW